MNKLSAVSELMNGSCDAIIHGTSEFILQGEDVVNKRSKKALDMKKMLEEGWDTKSLPRWDDAIRGGYERPTLCISENDGSAVIVLTMTEDGNYFTSCGDVYDIDTYGQLRPATKEEALALLADIKEAPQSKTRTKSKAKNEAKPEAKPEAIEEVMKEKPVVIKGRTDISETNVQHAESKDESIDLIGELPVAKDCLDGATASKEEEAGPNGEITPTRDGIDLEVDTTTPFDLEDTCDTACSPVAPAKAREPATVKEEACQRKTSKTTVMPKEETSIPDVEPEGEFVSLGLDKSDWPVFKKAYEAAGLDMQEEVNKGPGHCTTMIIQFAEQKAKKAKELASKHDTAAEIESKLEVFVDYGLEPEDAVGFYNFHKLDKFSLASLISDGTDEEVGQKITQFYDEMGE